MAALFVVGAWAFAEAVLLFIVADVPISALALRHGWRVGWQAALVAAICAALGGLVVVGWARADPAGWRAAFETLPGITPAMIDEAAARWREGGFGAMLAASFSGVPYKLYALAAAGDGSNAAGFFAISIAARLPRFVVVAAVFAVLGRALHPRLPGRIIAALFVAGWCGFYAWYFGGVGAL